MEAQAEENRKAREKIDEAAKTLVSVETVENSKITMNGKETTVFLALADRFGVDIPLRTRGYILKNLVSIKTNGTESSYYHYGGKSQTVCTCAVKIYVAAKRAQEETEKEEACQEMTEEEIKSFFGTTQEAAEATQTSRNPHGCEDTDPDGETSTYTGRYDLGDNDGVLIALIRAFAESKRNPGYFHDEQAAKDIIDLADVLEAHTASGRVVSVSLAPWFEKAVRERQKAAEEAKREEVQNIMDAVEMLTDQQLAAAVLHVPVDDAEKADVARFFLQALARRDEKKALSVFKAWRSGAGLEFLDEI